ncbi:hypothetical protein CDO52_06530 [Nocardiopsis gilva YIM 90087]|uniref:Uncharacterized protein n=1 Tax=Nocardiopsis gilva YIM 90087 TaxID=1235441 RepID=A0A223S2X9_9ACTN|nr:hypothetical protein [Nocardiopsis gilva]ASU82485.1 hypothetical protein CDO52_06530 [Nocardiopsis gilva YIM 90087]
MFRVARVGFAVGLSGPVPDVPDVPDPVAAPMPTLFAAPFGAFTVGVALPRAGDDRPPAPLAADVARFAAFGRDPAADVPFTARPGCAAFPGGFAGAAGFDCAGFALPGLAVERFDPAG